MLTRTFLIKMTALCLVISMCLIVSEVFVRIVIDDGMEYNLEMWKYARKLKRVAKHSDQGHQHIPDKSAFLMGVNVKINSQGYRNKVQMLDASCNTSGISGDMSSVNIIIV